MIGIIGAMQMEVEGLLHSMENPQPRQVGKNTYYSGRID